jgi:hypothetical protein
MSVYSETAESQGHSANPIWESEYERGVEERRNPMLKKTELIDATYGWIEALPKGTIFYCEQLYHFLEESFPSECRERGDAPGEPRYHNDARWAVRRAKAEKIVRSKDRRGKYQKI